MSRTVLIMAGGTGGHIFPGLAVAEYLSKQGWHVVWLGTRIGMERKLVVPHGYTMAWISMSGVRGKGILRALILPLQLLVAFWQSACALFRHRPDVVLGMGGYVSFPGGVMAAVFRCPLAIHEQNSIAGVANRVLATFADRVLTGFPTVFNDIQAKLWTGNPIRVEIAEVTAPEPRYLARAGQLRLAILGGSLGAQALNEVVPQALALIPSATRPRTLHQTGARHLSQVQSIYRELGVDAKIVPFIDDIARCYAESDLVICRAGALTIAELAAAGVASVLVPFPSAVDDHQTHNAHFLAARGAAILVPQTELTPQKLADLLGGFKREALLEMAKRAREAAKPEATQTVARVCMELAA